MYNSTEILRRQIIEAFGSVPYPGDQHLVTGKSLFHDEQQELSKKLKGRTWSSLHLEDLHNTNATLLTPRAFHYFLPAYLLLVMERYEDADVLPEYTLFWLDPANMDAKPRAEWFREFTAMLTCDQKEAICAYLDYLVHKFGEACEEYTATAKTTRRYYSNLCS